ncbi:MAG: aryl-sulfate sulfotransferase, partial [Mucilaginibacter sp.]
MKKILLFLIAFIVLSGCKKDKKTTPETPEVTVTTFTIPVEAATLNPSGNAPLSALLKFTSPISGHTEIVVTGKHGEPSDVAQTFTDNGTTHSIPIIGLYSDYLNTVKISVVDAQGNRANSTVTIQTGPLPVNTPTYIKVDFSDIPNMEPGLNLVSSFSGNAPPQTPFIMDSYGDIRWYLDFTANEELKGLYYDCGVARLHNGNFYFGNNRGTNKIYEVDILGKVVKSWAMGNYIFHHNVTEKANGNFLVSVSSPLSTHPNGSPTTEDYIIEIDRTSGEIITTWDLKESLDETRTETPNLEDWIHVNAVIPDTSDNTIIVSGRTQGLIKLTYDNKVKWILSPHYGFGKNRRGEDLNQYLLQPLDAGGNAITDYGIVSGFKNHTDFEWNWYQHSPVLMPNGDVLMFDNGTSRNFDTSLPKYSRAVEYKINPTNMTVQQVWQYGKERGLETFSGVVSSVKYLPEKNHILFSPGLRVIN